MTAYYNEIDPYAAQWLRNLIAAGHIAPGDVDERSIVDIQPDDLKGYTQVHLFAGIGGWSYAARLAGWPDERPLWSGSEPCQPYSVAGKGLAEADERYLRPHVHRLVSACRPAVYVGEQVAAAAGRNWLDRVHSDLESIGYTCRSVVVPACAVDAPHRRDRLWFVADSQCERRERREGSADRNEPDGPDARWVEEHCGTPGVREDARCGCDNVDNALGARLEGQRRHGPDGNESRRVDQIAIGSTAAAGGTVSDANQPGEGEGREQRGRQFSGIGGNSSYRPWAGSQGAIGADGKARRIEPGIRLLAHGVPARVGKLRAYGNAIVPQVAAEVIASYMDIVDGRVA